MKHQQHAQGWRAANRMHTRYVVIEIVTLGACYVAVIGFVCLVVKLMCK
jgi:hypothetical protein